MQKFNQLDDKGRLKHFLSIDGLSEDLLLSILDQAQKFAPIVDDTGRASKSVPLLRGKTIANLFFEPSTRTRTTFELAEKRLSADILNLDISTSATTKGESLLDTLTNLIAMRVDMMVVRHNNSGAAHFIATHMPPGISIINAGDGRHSHPTQAMLDMYTIRHYKQKFAGLSIAIVGDIEHSRVARSQIKALNILGCKDIRVVAPNTLMPIAIKTLGVTAYNNIEQGISGTDVIIILRLQTERMQQADLPSEREYFRFYGLTKDRLKLANKDAIVMHPGPINRGVEIASNIADSVQSVILQQVTFGISVRMAVLSILAGNTAKDKI